MLGKNRDFALLFLLLLAGLALTFYSASFLNLNFFQVHKPSEVYLQERGMESFSVHANFAGACEVCGVEREVNAGANEFSYLGCGGWVEVECKSAGVGLGFEKEGKVGSAPETRNSKLGAGSAFPLPQFLMLVFSLAFAWKAGAGRIWNFAVLLFLSISVLFVFYAQAESFGVGLAVLIFGALVSGFVFMGKGDWRLKLPEVDAKEALLFSVFGVALVLFSNLFIGSLDLWGPYYYRQAQNVFEKGTVFYQDELSYLGRGMTYPPAYFGFAANFAKLLFAPDFESVRLLQHLVVSFFFFASVYFLFFRYGGRQRILASLLLLSEIFIIVTASNVTLHILAYALMNFAVCLFLLSEGRKAGLETGDGRLKTVFGAVILAVAIGAHPTVALLFPVYALTANKFEFDLEFVLRGAVFLGAACLLALVVFYLPIFSKYGMPYEILPERWGYLKTWGIMGVLNDFGPVLALGVGAVVAALHPLAERVRDWRGIFSGIPKPVFSSALLFLLFLGVNTLVTFRVNMFLGVVTAGIVPMALGGWLEDRKTFALLCVFALFNLLVFFPLVQSGPKDWCAWGVANENCLGPMRFISANTPQDSVVALNPLFGHLEAYLGQRKVLADLYVEYADEGKYLAEEGAYETGKMPEGYDVDYLVLDGMWGKDRVGEEGLGKIYDNGYASVWER